MILSYEATVIRLNHQKCLTGGGEDFLPGGGGFWLQSNLFTPLLWSPQMALAQNSDFWGGVY